MRNVLIEIQRQYSDNTLRWKQVSYSRPWLSIIHKIDLHRILFQTCRIQPFSRKQPPQVWASAKHMTKIFPTSSMTTDQLKIRPTGLKFYFENIFCLGVRGGVVLKTQKKWYVAKYIFRVWDNFNSWNISKCV